MIAWWFCYSINGGVRWKSGGPNYLCILTRNWGNGQVSGVITIG
jgi:hypothetical protein